MSSPSANSSSFSKLKAASISPSSISSSSSSSSSSELNSSELSSSSSIRSSTSSSSSSSSKLFNSSIEKISFQSESSSSSSSSSSVAFDISSPSNDVVVDVSLNTASLNRKTPNTGIPSLLFLSLFVSTPGDASSPLVVGCCCFRRWRYTSQSMIAPPFTSLTIFPVYGPSPTFKSCNHFVVAMDDEDDSFLLFERRNGLLILLFFCLYRSRT